MSTLIERRAEIGLRIRKLRTDRNLTLQECAKKAGLSPGYLSDVERGQSAVSSEKLAAVAAVLSVSADYLLTGMPSGERTDLGSSIRIPRALSDVATKFGLSFSRTMQILEARSSLIARRSSATANEWTEEQWGAFYESVKPYLDS